LLEEEEEQTLIRVCKPQVRNRRSLAGSIVKKTKNWHKMENEISSLRLTIFRPEELIKSSIEHLEKKYVMGKSLGQGAFGEVLECWLKGTDGTIKFALKKMGKAEDKLT